MNKADIKGVIAKLAPDEGMELRISEKITEKQNNWKPLKYAISIAISLVVVISLGILVHNFPEKKSNISSNTISSTEGINIPKIELPKEPIANAKMIALIVYQDKIYTDTGTSIDPQSAEKLLGQKLGTTKGNLDEWSKQTDYAVEFASTIGKQDIYSVKGYDKSFRIMTYEKIDGTVYAQFFECFNGITVKKGDDLFGKLKIENNIKAAKQETFESWNNHLQQYKEFTKLELINSFVNELKNTVPYTQESQSYLWDQTGDTNQKFVYITLNDGCQVKLRLFKDGYIFYDYYNIFFKMEEEAFNKLWNELE